MDVLKVENLSIVFKDQEEETHALNGLSFSLKENEILGIVGESGSGKSVAVRSFLRLLPKEAEVKGKVFLEDKDLLGLSESALRDVRGKQIAMIFQDPMTSLNPLFTLGNQMIKVLQRHRGMSKKEAEETAIYWLERVGIPGARQRMKSYPHEFSGGMRQRVMIAMAMSLSPKILIADEPTTALDVTIQQQILNLLREVEKEAKNSVILITHDLGVVANTCDRVVILYGGMVMEEGTVQEIFEETAHPYTLGLLASVPRGERGEKLIPIPGQPVRLKEEARLCPFLDRCGMSLPICQKEMPQLLSLSPTHKVRCWRMEGGEDATF